MVGLGLLLRVLNCENQKEIYDITFNLDSTMLNERYTSPYYIWLTGIGSIYGKYIFDVKHLFRQKNERNIK